MNDGGRHDEPVPSALPEADLNRGRQLYTLDVDGEVFAVRSRDGGTDYDWLNGHNKDYGFSSSGRVEDTSREAHEESIRSFLAMIDPETGYVAED